MVIELIIPLQSSLEKSICTYYNKSDWLALARLEPGVIYVDYFNMETIVQFKNEAYKTLYLLRWS